MRVNVSWYASLTSFLLCSFPLSTAALDANVVLLVTRQGLLGNIRVSWTAGLPGSLLAAGSISPGTGTLALGPSDRNAVISLRVGCALNEKAGAEDVSEFGTVYIQSFSCYTIHVTRWLLDLSVSLPLLSPSCSSNPLLSFFSPFRPHLAIPMENRRCLLSSSRLIP